MTRRRINGALALLAGAGLTLAASVVRAAQNDAGPEVEESGTHRVRVSAELAGMVDHAEEVDYGAFSWLTLTDAQYAALVHSEIPYQEDALGFTLRLGEMSFDPRARVPVAAPQPARAADAPDLRLIQFDGPAMEEWLAGLRARGLEVVQYIAPHAYVVWGTAGQRDRAATMARVRWTGDFLPEYRVLPAQRIGRTGRDSARALVYRGADIAALRQQLQALGADLTGAQIVDERFVQLTFDIDAPRIAEAAELPGVYTAKFVPRDGGLRGELSNQINVNNVSGTNAAFPGYLTWLAGVGLSGSGVIIANVDDGVSHTHVNLASRMLPCIGSSCAGSASSSHGTHTAGIMVADGTSGVMLNGFQRGLGMAPGARLIEQLYNPTFAQANGMLTLMRHSVQNGAIVSGNSWGPAGTPQGYDDDTMQVDIGVRDADSTTPGHQPLHYILSIMNGYGGVSSQGSPDEAKNIFTIGSTKAQNSSGSQNLAINDLSSNTAHGPARDGRKIPHMVAPGCNVDSTVPTNSYGVSGWCGTSMASPHVSGAAALFIESYRGLPGYTADPSPAMLKAAFLAVARNLAGNRDANNGILGIPFDSKQGWGRMNAAAVLDPPLSVRYFDNPMVFDNTGEEWTAHVAAADPGQPMRIMLVWTDAPGHGLGGTTPAWNNNLDLIVESGANTYLGNVFAANGYSTTGGVADIRNNTEGVFLLTPGAGNITLRVQAASINSDAIPGVGDGTDQDFALVCYNCAAADYFELGAAPDELDVCAPDDAVFTVDVLELAAGAAPVTLSVDNPPAGATVDFSVNPVNPTGSSVLTINNTGAIATGANVIDLTGSSSEGTKHAAVTFNLFAAPPPAVELVSPTDGAIGMDLTPTLLWSAVADAQAYTLELATDADFANIVHSESTAGTNGVPAAPLLPLTGYYWRVRADNVCGPGLDSAVRSLTTKADPPVPGDYDGDGDVDLADMAGWSDCMTGPLGGPVSAPCTAFDLDADQDVDMEDFAVMQALLGV